MGGSVHRIPWDEEGKNDSNEGGGWFEQCKAHVRALQMMIAWATAGVPLTADKLLECHTVLMRGARTVASEQQTFDSRFRVHDEPVMAGDYIFPNRTDHKKDLVDQLEKRNAEFDTSHPLGPGPVT
jgi:hypothetical protein